MEKISSAEVIVRQLYPLAPICHHEERFESLEQELEDDQYRNVIVERCSSCHFPMESRVATDKEAEAIENAKR